MFKFHRSQALQKNYSQMIINIQNASHRLSIFSARAQSAWSMSFAPVLKDWLVINIKRILIVKTTGYTMLLTSDHQKKSQK